MKKIFKKHLKASILLIVCTFLAGSLLNNCEKVPEENPDNASELMPGDTIALTDITETLSHPLQVVPWHEFFPDPIYNYPDWDTTLIFNSEDELLERFNDTQAADLLVPMLNELSEIDFDNQTLLICGGAARKAPTLFRTRLYSTEQNDYFMHIKTFSSSISIALKESWARFYLISHKIETGSNIELYTEEFVVEDFTEEGYDTAEDGYMNVYNNFINSEW